MASLASKDLGEHMNARFLLASHNSSRVSRGRTPGSRDPRGLVRKHEVTVYARGTDRLVRQDRHGPSSSAFCAAQVRLCERHGRVMDWDRDRLLLGINGVMDELGETIKLRTSGDHDLRQRRAWLAASPSLGGIVKRARRTGWSMTLNRLWCATASRGCGQ